MGFHPYTKIQVGLINYFFGFILPEDREQPCRIMRDAKWECITNGYSRLFIHHRLNLRGEAWLFHNSDNLKNILDFNCQSGSGYSGQSFF